MVALCYRSYCTVEKANAMHACEQKLDRKMMYLLMTDVSLCYLLRTHLTKEKRKMRAERVALSACLTVIIRKLLNVPRHAIQYQEVSQALICLSIILVSFFYGLASEEKRVNELLVMRSCKLSAVAMSRSSKNRPFGFSWKLVKVLSGKYDG